MGKIKKSELLDIAREQGSAITNLLQRVTLLEKPQLKQLDQSVFDGLDEKWRFSAVDKGGAVWVYSGKPDRDRDCGYWFVKEPVDMLIGRGYDASNWQNSLIEREIAKELTGSDLARAMLERGDKYIVCTVDYGVVVITGSNKDGSFFSTDCAYTSATPINNKGEPLTAAEVGL